MNFGQVQGVIVEIDGQEMVGYFAEEEALDAASPSVRLYLLDAAPLAAYLHDRREVIDIRGTRQAPE